MTQHLPLALRILAWRVRPVLLVLVVVAACGAAARIAAPPAPPTGAVVVAAQDLPAGTVLADADLRTVRLPARAVPASAARDPETLVGATVAVDVPRGLPVVEEHLARSRFVREPPAGTVAVPVHLADAALTALLRPGDRIDLVAGTLDGWPGEDGPRVLAEAALVLEVRAAAPDDDGGPGLLAGPVDATEPLVVVAVAAAEGHRIAAAEGGSVGAVLVQGS